MYGQRVLTLFMALALAAWAFLSLTLATEVRAHEPAGSDPLCMCADQLGGFGPLWASYCSDKQRCRPAWGQRLNAACYTGICSVPPPPLFGRTGWLTPKWRTERRACAICNTAHPTPCDAASNGEESPIPPELIDEQAWEPRTPDPSISRQEMYWPSLGATNDAPAATPPASKSTRMPAQGVSSRRTWTPQKEGAPPGA